MTDAEKQAVARLKESKRKATEDQFKAGEAVGAHYVLLEGTQYVELERLERWYANQPGANVDAVLEASGFRALAREMDEDAEAATDDIVRSAHGDDIDNPTWLKGFISGALSKFTELKPHLC